MEIRIELIDPERGMVIGYAILQYANSRQMQINEIFKILDGRIRLVDNIGLMGSESPRRGLRSKDRALRNKERNADVRKFQKAISLHGDGDQRYDDSVAGHGLGSRCYRSSG